MNNNPFVRGNRRKKKAYFGARNHKSKSCLDPSEYVPLTLGDEFDSDDEITLHDIELLRVRQRGPARSLSTSNLQENVQLQERNEGSCSDPFLDCDLIPVDVKNEDTLQGISVKYDCPISDLKRANNIISNQEFYGLGKVKIPVRKHGFLSELLLDVDNSPSVSASSANGSRTIQVGILPACSKDSPEKAADFLRRMDEDLIKIVSRTKTHKDSLEDATAVLSAPLFLPLDQQTQTKESGLTYSHLIYCIALLVIILPIVMIVYVYHYDVSAEPHNDTVISSTSLGTSPTILNLTKR